LFLLAGDPFAFHPRLALKPAFQMAFIAGTACFEARNSHGDIMQKRTLWVRATFCCLILCASLAGAHGIVGNRFFPPTITTDDPFATDEFAFPTITYTPGSDTRETDYSFEFDKEILPHFALGVSDTYIAQTGRDGGPSAYGWDNVQLSAKYQLWRNDTHEAIISIGLISQVGGTGSDAVSDSFSTFIPTFYYGKGFGDLPDSVAFLKPFALTGTLAQTFPTSAQNPNQFQWGFALQYSLPYLQQHVKDVGLPAPFKDLIPLVEFSMQTDENGDTRGITTGTINPGVLWETPYVQFGAEALIPVNSQSGPHVGFVVQTWIFIDDLFPAIFGHPLFGSR
jgi:hypothetical protein